MKDYQVMPPLTDEEYAELKADIAERGVQVAIEFDQDGNVIDGYHRFKICQELGWIDENGNVLNEDKVEWNVRIYDSEEEKFTQARKLNLMRRHLNREQRRELIRDQLKATPETPDYKIAELLGVSDKTVTAQRDFLESRSEIPNVPTVTDSMGRKQPKRKPPVIRHPSTRDAEALHDPDIQQRLVENEDLNVAGAIREQKRDRLVERLESIETKEAKAIEGVYDVVVIDPPWALQKIERDARPNQAGLDYPVMSIDEIKQLKIPAADDCHVFLWTTQKFLHEAFHVMEAWNVKPIWTFVWVKNNGVKPYGLPTSTVEFVLYGHIGAPEFVNEKAFRSDIMADATGHSKKPEAFYDMVRNHTAGRRLDMFNRRSIEGFDAWGKEATNG